MYDTDFVVEFDMSDEVSRLSDAIDILTRHRLNAADGPFAVYLKLSHACDHLNRRLAELI